MRVLTIVRNFGQRGTQRAAENFSTAYVRLQHEVGVLAFEQTGPRLANYVENGVAVLPPYQNAPEEAIRQARAFNPDLIHVHRSGVTHAGETQLLRELKRPHNCVLETNVFSRFDPEADPHIDLHGQITRPGLYRWQKLANGRSRGVGFYLPYLMNYEVWRPPAASRAQELRRRLDISDQAIVLGTIGKTHPGLGRVLKDVLASSKRVHWVAVESDETRQIVAALPQNVRQFCHFLTPTDSNLVLTHYYSLFDLLLHWSANGESFGMVLAESVAVGTPVVMPLQLHRDLGGIEVIGHNEGGLIAGSGHELARTCMAAIDDLPLLRQRLTSAQARHHAEYDAARVARQATIAAEAILRAGEARPDRRSELERLGFEISLSDEAMNRLISQHCGERSRLEAVLFRVTHDPTFNDVRRSAKALKTLLASRGSV